MLRLHHFSPIFLKVLKTWQSCGRLHPIIIGESARLVPDEQRLVENIREIVNEQMVNSFTSTNFDDLINIAPAEKASSSEAISARDLGLKAKRKAEGEESAKLVSPNLTTCFSRKKSAPSKAQNLVKIY